MAALSDVLAQIRQRESSNNYTLTPQQNYAYPASHASGAYQFQPATWQYWTQQSGYGTQYSEAYQAPPGVQDAVAAYAATHGNINSSALWGASSGVGGYPAITAVDVTPDQLAQGAGAGTGSGAALPGDVPQIGGDYGGLSPEQVTSAPAVAAGGAALQQIGGFLGNWLVRGGVIVAGLVLIAAAAFHLAKPVAGQAAKALK